MTDTVLSFSHDCRVNIDSNLNLNQRYNMSQSGLSQHFPVVIYRKMAQHPAIGIIKQAHRENGDLSGTSRSVSISLSSSCACAFE